MSADIGQWIVPWATHWPDLGVDIEYYHIPNVPYRRADFYPLSAPALPRRARSAFLLADRTHISLYRDLRATAGPYGHTMQIQAGY